MPDPHRQRELTDLIHHLGLPNESPVDWTLLDLALTHPTASTTANYEQLEFVGDAVVRMAVAELLFQRYPEWPVGEYAALRSILVSDRVLAQIAAHYELDRYLRSARSALNDQTGAESRKAEAMEAVLGALYLSTHTLELIHPWLDPHLENRIQEVRNDPARQNYKAALQEWTQASYKALPEYRVQEMAGSHGDPNRFIAEVWFQAKLLGKGSGRSIKAAEQAAAQMAFLAVQAQSMSLIQSP